MLDVGRHAKELCQVTTSRTAGDADAVRIDLVFLGIGPQPTNRRLDVMDGSRELVFRRQPITCRGGDVALFGQPDAEAIVALASAGPEAAPVNAEDRWKRTVAHLGAGQVELEVLTVRVGVLDVRLEDDRVGHLEFGGILARGIGSQAKKQEQDGPRCAGSGSWMTAHGCLRLASS